MWDNPAARTLVTRLILATTLLFALTALQQTLYGGCKFNRVMLTAPPCAIADNL